MAPTEPFKDRSGGAPDARAARARLRRTQAQFEAIGRIGQADTLLSGDLMALAREITGIAARTVGCERVNVWQFDDSESELVCLDNYTLSTGAHDSEAVLRESEFADEFRALKTERFVAADDALADPRIAGYREGYTRPLGITAMLDTAIRAADRNLGVVCFEHVNTPHRWTEDEIAFAGQLADKLAFGFANARRLQAERHLRLALDAMPIPLTWASLEDGRIGFANRKFTETFGYRADDFATVRDWVERAYPVAEHRARAERSWFAFFGNPTVEEFDIEPVELDVRCANGTVKTVVHGGIILPEAGWALATFVDISERKRAEEQIRHMARFDELTGLANRRVFVEAAERACARARRTGERFGVLYLDLDHFKDVNDTLGHPAGDALLRGVAERLAGSVRETDTVARFGGDEFAVLASDVDDPADLAALADKLLATLREPFTVESNTIRTGSSIGVAVFGSDSPDPEALLSHADVALYRAKSDGRGIYRFFTEAMDVEVRGRVRLADDLRTAIAEDGLFLAYQPQVDIATGRIVGLEALVRWRHPELGMLPPSEIVSAAERHGLAAALGNRVLARACAQLREWLDAGIAVPRLAVNLSALQFKAPVELERDMDTALAAAGIEPARIELELTETAFMATSSEHGEVLERLRTRGFTLAIDDFGTGYSSLDRLRRLPADRIKLSEHFIAEIATDTGAAAIVKAAIAIAREFGLPVIAEGVETKAQLDLLKEWGCTEAQGFFYASPVDAGQLAGMLRCGTLDPDAAAGGRRPPPPLKPG